MNVIVLGATGATGIHLVKELLAEGHHVKAVVRSPKKLGRLTEYTTLEVVEGNSQTMPMADMQKHVLDCDAVASCLGHTPNLKGIYRDPKRLVTTSVSRWCQAIAANKQEKQVKMVLMNTAGNTNRDLDEHISFAQRAVLGLIRLLLPPHVDNECAADYLRVDIGQKHPYIQWAAVRPDDLVDEPTVTAYETHASPARSAIFDPGKTSRRNVANFMARLIADVKVWEEWKGQMPVIYNLEPAEA